MMVTSQPSLAQTRALATAISELLRSIRTVSLPRSATILYAMPHPLRTWNLLGNMFRYGFGRNLPIVCPIGGMARRGIRLGSHLAAAWALIGRLSHLQRRFGRAIEAGQHQHRQKRVLRAVPGVD